MHPRIHELLEYLDEQRRDLRAAFESVRPALREQVPGPKRWSVANIIEHLAMVEQRLAGRFSARVAEARAEGVGPETSSDPVLPTFDVSVVQDRASRRTAPDAVQPTGLHANAAWRSLEEATTALRAAILDGDGLALGAVSLRHPVIGAVSLYHYIAITGAHETRHAGQIREIAEMFRAAQHERPEKPF